LNEHTSTLFESFFLQVSESEAFKCARAASQLLFTPGIFLGKNEFLLDKYALREERTISCCLCNFDVMQARNSRNWENSRYLIAYLFTIDWIRICLIKSQGLLFSLTYCRTVRTFYFTKFDTREQSKSRGKRNV